MNPHSNGMHWPLIFLAPVLIQQSIAQTSWQWQNPLPQGDNIEQIQFVNATRGWIVVWSRNLLHTSDGGQTWEPIPSNISLRRISFIDENRGWGIGSDHPFTYHAGVYHTTDGGRTWAHQYTDSVWGPLEDIKFTDPRNGWAIGQGFMRHTSDGGVTWQPQTAYVRPAGGDYTISFRDSLRGWAGGWQFYASTTLDGGQTWVRDSSLEGYNRFVFVDTLYGWASSTFESWRRRMVARTTDGGLTWFETPSPLRGLAFPISETHCIAFGDTGVYRTINGGASWALIHTHGYRDGFVQSASNMWATQYLSSSFFHSTDEGYTWANRTNDAFGPGYSVLYSVDFVDTLHGWAVGGAGFAGNFLVGRTKDGGRHWTRLPAAFPSEPLSVSFVSPTTGWVTGRNGLIRKTSDGGLNWQQQASGTLNALWDVQFLDSLKGFAAGAGGVVVKTTNGGEEWLDITPAGVGGLGSIQFVDSLFGWIGGSPFFMKTTDGGETWFNPISDPTIVVGPFFFVSRERGWAYGPYSAKPWQTSLLTTYDGGATWVEQERDSTSADMFGGGVSFVDSVTGWMVGHGGSIWFTSNGGLNWENQTGITARFLRGIATVPPKKAWVVGDVGTIINYGNDGTVSVRENNGIAIPEKLYVSQNYPNPFNAQTSLRYRIPKAGLVTLELFDLLGRLVKKSDEGYRTAGDHTLTIRLEDAASGIYFFKLTSSGQYQWGKIVLIR